jgi:sterol desaturase/sphingolipid hydroxylase (fatty acid hydroxylase superfamily)
MTTQPSVTTPLGTSRRGLLQRLLVGAMIAAGIVVQPGAILFVVLVFSVLVPLERRFPRHTQRLRRPGLGTDIAYLIVRPLLTPIGIAVAVVIGAVSLAWLPGILLRPLVAVLPTAVRGVAGLLLFDMAGYWSHPLDGVVTAVPVAFLLGAGFSPKFSAAVAVLKVVTGLLLHTNIDVRWWRLQPFIITPEFHHWHHSSESDAINRNYSTFLPVWDRVFGTYFVPASRRPQRYGARPAVPDGLIAQLVHPLRRRTPNRPAAS